MTQAIFNRLKNINQDNAIWACFRAALQLSETYCVKIPDTGLDDAELYIIHHRNEALVVMCNKADSKGRTRFDELIDEENFNDSEPLWFTELSHRVSPVYHLRRYMQAVELAFAKHAQYATTSVKGVLLVNSNLINYDTCIGGYENLGVIIKDNMENPIGKWSSENLTASPFLTYALEVIARNISKIKISSTEIEDDYNYLPEDDEDYEPTDFDDELDRLFESFYDPDNNETEEEETETGPDTTVNEPKPEPVTDRGRIESVRDLSSFLRSNPNPVHIDCDMDLPDIEIYYPLPEAKTALDKMTGLTAIKDKIYDFSCLAQYNQRLKQVTNSPQHTLNLHAVFSGNPGTGKSTMGRIWASLLQEHGQLTHGHLVLATRSSFLGTKWGSEEENLSKIMAVAEGGVLMIDEAYSLVSAHPTDPGRLILPLLLSRLADESRRNISVILAGYPTEMESLLKTNPGITSRFPNVFDFKDFTFDELCRITLNKIDYYGYSFTKTAWKKYKEELDKAFSCKDRKHFGNARFVANYLENIYLKHAKRIVSRHIESADILRLTAEDIPLYEPRATVTPSIGFNPMR